MLPMRPVIESQMLEPAPEANTDGRPVHDVAHEHERWAIRNGIIDVIFGLAALAVGIAGLVLPLLPGWLAIFAGLGALAGRIPALRRLISRIILLPRVQRGIDRLACNPRTRSLITRMMMRTRVRAAVEPQVRWRVVHLLARRNSETARESAEEAG